MKAFAPIVLLAALSAPPTAPLRTTPPEHRDPGFTWGNDVPALIREGNDVYTREDFDAAARYYQDAQVMRPDEGVTAFNLGLAEARQGNREAAAAQFRRALDLAGENETLRREALFNFGVNSWEQARELMDEASGQRRRDDEAVMRRALDSLDAFNGVLEMDPDDVQAVNSKEYIQHFLQQMSEPPPEQQQQPQQGENGDQQQEQQQQDDSGQQQQQDQQQGQSSDQQSSGEQQEQQGQEEQQEADQEGEQQDQQEGEADQQQEETEEGEEQAGEPVQADELTEEQARQLLNLLGEERNVILRKRGFPANRPHPDRDW